MPLPRVRYLAFGGTISSIATRDGSGVTPTLQSDALLAGLPELAAIAEIDAVDFPAVASFEVTPGHMHALATAVNAAFADGCDGVVITHGTDTIEESAYAVALMAARERPVAFAGAMRNPTMTAPDGPANLVSAFRVAASREARELGTVLVLNDEIHSARFATKTHTSKPSTFASPPGGPIGEITEGRVDVWYRPAWDDHLGLPASLEAVPVRVVPVESGGSEALLAAAVDEHPAGIVVIGTGGGHVPAVLHGELDRAIASGIPVVVASRLISGSTYESTYGMPGGEIDLLRRGAILAGRLSPQKARLRLMVGIALGLDPRTLFPVR